MSERINSIIETIGFQFTIGDPTGAVKEDWPCIQYPVTVTHNGQTVWSDTYSLGVGHVQWKAGLACPNFVQAIINTKKAHPFAVLADKQAEAKAAAYLAKEQKVKPSPADVLASLVLDGSPYFDNETFEDWAGNFGYDTDSRKAEAIYKTCDATGRSLARHISRADLENLREACQEL